jgi:hypothetical protein
VRRGDIHLLTVAGLPASTVAKFIDDTTMAVGGGNLDPKLQPRLVLISQQVAQMVDTHQGMAKHNESKQAELEAGSARGEVSWRRDQHRPNGIGGHGVSQHRQEAREGFDGLAVPRMAAELVILYAITGRHRRHTSWRGQSTPGPAAPALATAL